MTLEDRYFAIKNDPKKRARAFKIMWIASYAMLMIGAFLTIYFLIYKPF